VVSVMDPYGCIFGLLDRIIYFRLLTLNVKLCKTLNLIILNGSSTLPSYYIFSSVRFWRWFVVNESVRLVFILQPDQGGNPETEVQ
jgi:hypothetical protein